MTQRTPEEIITACIEVLQRQLPPNSGIEAKDAISNLWEILDSPEAAAIYEAELARRGQRNHKP